MRLSKAIQNNEIKVYYQPKIEAGSTRIIGGEALVRWQKADGSFIYPDEFIPDLETEINDKNKKDKNNIEFYKFENIKNVHLFKELINNKLIYFFEKEKKNE